MTLYFETERGKLYLGDCLDVMKIFPDNSIDTLITDPPYGLSFMGKKWDYEVPSVEIWRECLRILKPGATALIFAGSRTQHRMAVNVEDAGFILKDCIMWLYGSGFPKSTAISKQLDKMAGRERTVVSEKFNKSSFDLEKQGGGGFQRGTIIDSKPATPEAQTWEGYGTNTKPAYEPILVAMKPNDGTYAQNALKHGVAGLNIDGGRIAGTVKDRTKWKRGTDNNIYGKSNPEVLPPNPKGRFPANIILDEGAAKLLDEQSGVLKSGASRFFYTAKSSKSERGKNNIHPTVKPLPLMEYLCNLTKTPTGGIVLDPFAGSGTTALACIETQRGWVLIEREKEYCEIAAKRIEEAASQMSF